MKKILIVICLIASIGATAQKYEAYEFNSYNRMVTILENDGYDFPQPLPMDCQLIDTDNGTALNFHYIGKIVTNYPKTDSTWVAEYSSNVYTISVKEKASKIKNKYKVTGQLRKYIWQYIARFAGEKDNY